MVDERTRALLLNIVNYSITATDLTEELKRIINQRGKPQVLRGDNGPELDNFCGTHVGIHYIPPGEPWNNEYAQTPQQTQTLNK